MNRHNLIDAFLQAIRIALHAFVAGVVVALACFGLLFWNLSQYLHANPTVDLGSIGILLVIFVIVSVVVGVITFVMAGSGLLIRLYIRDKARQPASPM